MPVAKPTLVIPTGYESQQRQIERKRKIADALMAQGLSSENGLTSWTQVLGKMAQAWTGKRLDRKASEAGSELDAKILGDYLQKRGGFNTDAKAMDPGQLREKYGGDPMLADDLKPYSDAFGARLKDEQTITNFGGQGVRKGDTLGRFENNPNNSVMVGPDGMMSVNPVKVAASVASQGLPLQGPGGDQLYQTSMKYPGVVSAMQGQAPGGPPMGAAPGQGISEQEAGPILAQAAQTKSISAQDAMRVSQSFGPQGQSAMMAWAQQQGIRVKVSSPQEAQGLPSGTPLILPDGTEGVVP